MMFINAVKLQRRLKLTFEHLCTYVHMYTFIIYIHTYIHTGIRTHVHTYVHTYMHTYMHTYRHTNTRTYVCTYVHTPTYIHTYIRMYNDIMVVELDVMPKSIVENDFTIVSCRISHECQMLSTSVVGKLFLCYH